MKKFLLAGWLSLSGVLSALATDPIYINDLGVNSPPDVPPNIDATIWLNRATFNIDNSLNFLPLPYETKDTLFFTNSAGGVLFGAPGYRFFNNTGGQRLWMDTWNNSGPISTDASLFFPVVVGNALVANSQSSVLMVHATNIISSGPLRSGAQGLIYLEGKQVNLRRNGLHTGAAAQTNNPFFFSGSFLLSSNYVDDFGITDVWWGAGTNNNLNNKGLPIRVDSLGFDLPFPSSPVHQVVEAFTGSNLQFTNTVILPQFSFGNYTAAVWTNQVTPSNFVIQVVFYPTNTIGPNFTVGSDTNFTTDVRFLPDFSGASIPVVAFNSVDFDIVDLAWTSNSVFLSDALGTVTNVFLARNQAGNTRRPDTMEVSRMAPFGFYPDIFGFQNSLPTNAIFDPSLFWKPSYRFNTVTNLYAAYEAQISSVATSAGTTGGNPTNFPGRIQIIGEDVDLNLTRIRAETSLSIKATHNLSSNHIAQIDAPFVSFDVRSLAPQLLISNIAPLTVRRLSGTVAAWSGTWDNFETVSNILTNITSVVTNGTTNTTLTVVTNTSTNQLFFHVLIVDPAFQPVQPVVVYDFAAHATNLVIYDTLNIGKSFLADATCLDIKGGVILPYGSGWASSNIQNVLNFTNEGTVSVPQIANVGADRATPYYNYVNRGNITAGAHFIRTTNFDNSGTIIASGGLLQLDTLSASMMGPPLSILTNVTTNPGFIFTNGFFTNVLVVSTNVITNSIGARLQGNSDIQIYADSMVVSNSFFQAGAVNGGALIFAVTNRLTDSGVVGTNHWFCTAGFQMWTHPVISDLIGTYLIAVLPNVYQEAFNIWCADDRGATVDGFNNNLALGKLTLDGKPNSLFHFAPPTGQTHKAMYVDYLELLNFATNYNSGALDIDPEMTIYFADSNLNPLKLDGSNGGRLRWVRDFLGPLSSTNITYPSGHVYTFNTALVESRDLDSDGDGIVNALDPTPIFEPEEAGLAINMVNGLPHMVQLSWYTLARSTNKVQYISNIKATNWITMTNMVSGPTNGIMRCEDSMSQPGTRFYRIRVDMP